MLEYKIERTGNVSVLILSGDVTVESAEELKKALIGVLDSTDQVVISIEKVRSIDLACLQLLCSAHRTSVRLNKDLALGGVRPESFRQAFRNTGFSRHSGCVADRFKSCLWAGQ